MHAAWVPRGSLPVTASGDVQAGNAQARIELGGLEHHAGHAWVELAAQLTFGGTAHGGQRLAGGRGGALRARLRGDSGQQRESEQAAEGQ